MKFNSFFAKDDWTSSRGLLQNQRVSSSLKPSSIPIVRQNPIKALRFQEPIDLEHEESLPPSISKRTSKPLKKDLMRRRIDTTKIKRLEFSNDLESNISASSNNNTLSAGLQKNMFSRGCDPNTPIIRLASKSPIEIILNRYSVSQIISQTEFNDSLEALDLKDNLKVFIKIKRNGLSVPVYDGDYLNDPKIMQLKNQFILQDQQYLVFEYLKCSLRDQKHLVPREEISYALLQAIASLHSQSLVHCNIAPENIFFNDHSNVKLKFCKKMVKEDFLLAINRYSAPELILDCPYRSSVDMWSFGCILAELFIGRPLFDGQNEKEILKSIMNVLGVPPHTLLKQGLKTNRFFKFKQSQDLFVPKTHRILPSHCQLSEIEEIKNNYQLIDLLERCLSLNPINRINAKEALLHPFFSRSISIQS